jgi:hypothetical protein
VLAFLLVILLQRFYFTGHVEGITYSEEADSLVISTDLIRGKQEKGAVEIIAAVRKNPSIKEEFILKNRERRMGSFDHIGRSEDWALLRRFGRDGGNGWGMGPYCLKERLKLRDQYG